MKTLVSAILLSVLAAPARAQDEPALRGRTLPLFIIARSKNKNIVQYEARLDTAGRLSAKSPVRAYWKMLAVRPDKTEGLNVLERKLAYGFDVRRDTVLGVWAMSMKAYPRRMVRVRQTSDTVRAELTIATRRATIDSLYVLAHERLFFLPKVDHIEVYGKDLETGLPLCERIFPSEDDRPPVNDPRSKCGRP